MLSSHQSSLNQLWANLLLTELSRHGIRHLCLAPGSRSTPLVMAADRLAQQSDQPHKRLQLHHHFDERGLGFLALGIAKASQQPVAVITTSGTAVANLYSAVIEAAQTGVPLLILSADRPPRLHDCGANQAINQQGIFADYPRHSLYLPPPSLDYPVDKMLLQVSTAIKSIADGLGGVCQINCMYDEPLYPDSTTIDFTDYLASICRWRDSDRPFTSRPDRQAKSTDQPSTTPWTAFIKQPGVIVVGALPDHTTAAAVKALGQRLGWPLLVDIQSQLQTDPDCLGLTDQLLCDQQTRIELDKTRQLLQFGTRLVSKRLQNWVDQQPWQQFWLVHPGKTPLAPGHNCNTFVGADIQSWCQQRLNELTAITASATRDGQLPLRFHQLQHCHAQLCSRLQQQLSVDTIIPGSTSVCSSTATLTTANQPELTELSAAYQLLQHLPASGWLLTGNSLSIRLLDLVGTPRTDAGLPQIYANRGASGIDGLVSTAIGLGLGHCSAKTQPGTLLLGDYSLLYDLNALALLRDHSQPLVIVVFNNDGGGIFRMLPVADEALRQRHYQRPHGLTFEHACLMFGIDYHQPRSLADFIDTLHKAHAASGSCLIEISAEARTTEQQIKALTADTNHQD